VKPPVALAVLPPAHSSPDNPTGGTDRWR
jgi:hypothetical protein